MHWTGFQNGRRAGQQESRTAGRLGQATQKQQRPRCPDRKIYLEIRETDEGLLSLIFSEKSMQFS